jgi:hypothetical protein
MFEFSLQYPTEVDPSVEGGPVTIEPKGYWTKDKKKIKGSEFKVPKGANDFHLIFRVSVQFTKNRKPLGPEVPAPKGANDVHLTLKPAKQNDGGDLTGVLDDFGDAIAQGDAEQSEVLLAALKQMLRDGGCL